MEKEYLYPKSKTISIPQVRQIREVAHTMDLALTEQEFIAIITVYNHAIERLLKENGEEV